MNTTTLHILYEDAQIIVCAKPHGIPTQCRQAGTPDMESLIKNHIHTTCSAASPPYLAVIHRLDQPVSGILVFAKTPAAARDLNNQLTQGHLGKYYMAITDHTPPASEGTLENYLVKDTRQNMSRVCQKNTPGAKLAILHYRTVEGGVLQEKPRPQLEIRLITGRHHQIRVQLAYAGFPITGDTKYNPDTKKPQTLMLCAYKLTFLHPTTKKEMQFEVVPFPAQAAHK